MRKSKFTKYYILQCIKCKGKIIVLVELSGVNATNIPGDLSVEWKVVWFQCPWSLNQLLSTLMRRCLNHMVEKGVNYVLVGITKCTSM